VLPINEEGDVMQRWSVKDVMTHNVISVRESTPYKEIVEALAGKKVSAVPVVDADGRVLGVVSEADLLHKMEFSGPEPHVQLLERKARRMARAKASGDIAGDLMTSPAVTVSSGASLTAAAKIMDDQRVKRLPVVDERGHLVGIVARADLLRVYLRDDVAIRDEIREEVLKRTLWIDPATVTVTVNNGVVRLGGTIDRRSTGQIAARLCETVAGVVEVINEMTYGYDDTEALRRDMSGVNVWKSTP
jgi:CBS domain-containing protein